MIDSQVPFTVRPLRRAFVAEIEGVDLPNATAEQLAAFDQTCRTHSVVVVRNQHLLPSHLVSLGERFGKLSPQWRVGPHPDQPAISILSNKVVDGKPIGVHESGRAWHSDGTTYPTLGLTTLLYGVETPPEGGDTLWADTRAAYAALPSERRQALEGLRTVHNRALLFERTNGPRLTSEERERMQDVMHPLVVDSPIGGGKSLFLTRGSLKGVEGMSDEDGRALIMELVSHVTQDQYVYRHKWREHDLVIWDNLCTMHQATPFDDTRFDRVVYRVWVRPLR